MEAYEWVNDARESTAKIVMEYCERGCVLDDERETFERFDLSDVKAIARDCFARSCRTVSTRDNIAHYDVKPQNIFASASGAYKLGDFGCATRVKPIAVRSRREAEGAGESKSERGNERHASEPERRTNSWRKLRERRGSPRPSVARANRATGSKPTFGRSA